MALQEDVYFLGSVQDTAKRNKDDDVVGKHYCCVDFDLRENYKAVNNAVL
jgi:hypothetical protein